MTDKDTSTLKSYADSAVAAGQSLLGSITGNPVDKVSNTHRIHPKEVPFFLKPTLFQ